MLGSVKDSDWSVLIMDAVTTKVMSSMCRISEVLDYGVSCALPGLSPPTGAAWSQLSHQEETLYCMSLLPAGTEHADEAPEQRNAAAMPWP
jgi:hypothetical protein